MQLPNVTQCAKNLFSKLVIKYLMARTLQKCAFFIFWCILDNFWRFYRFFHCVSVRVCCSFNGLLSWCFHSWGFSLHWPVLSWNLTLDTFSASIFVFHSIYNRYWVFLKKQSSHIIYRFQTIFFMAPFSVTRWRSDFSIFGHLKHWNFSKWHKLFCQSRLVSIFVTR